MFSGFCDVIKEFWWGETFSCCSFAGEKNSLGGEKMFWNLFKLQIIHKTFSGTVKCEKMSKYRPPLLSSLILNLRRLTGSPQKLRRLHQVLHHSNFADKKTSFLLCYIEGVFLSPRWQSLTGTTAISAVHIIIITALVSEEKSLNQM